MHTRDGFRIQWSRWVAVASIDGVLMVGATEAHLAGITHAHAETPF